jgi:ribosomal protein S18 acetylase RimI-like enzyme
MQPVEATMSDVAELGRFFLEAWGEAGGAGALGFSGATEETIREIASEEFIRKRLANSDVRMYIAREKKRVLGFAATRRIDQARIELSGMIVLESATGRGIGTQLVKRVLSAARQAGFETIVVKTETANERAINFYKKMGLKEIGTAREPVDGTSVDVTLLEKELQRSN